MISKYYKALTAFVVGFGVFLTAALGSPEVAAALPEGATKWLVVVAVPAVVALGAFLVRNENTVAEAEALVRRAQERVSAGKQPE